MANWDWQVFCKDTIDGEVVPRCFGSGGSITYLDWMLSAWGWTVSVALCALLLALVAGLSINGTFAALFSSIVPFSVFPIISLVLTVYCLHQRYQNRTMPVGLPGLAAACFILGVLLYSTVVRAEYPDIGSNFFPAVLSVILVFWIGFKVRNRKQEIVE